MGTIFERSSGMFAHMTRRTFVRMGAAGGAALAGLASCSRAEQPASRTTQEPDRATGPAQAPESGAAGDPPSADAPAAEGAPAVFFIRAVDAAALRAAFDALGEGLPGKVGVKLSTGEPGGDHYLKAELIGELVRAVGGTIVECNTAYGGGRATSEEHYRVAADHGFADIAEVQIMDEGGSLALPVDGGLRLSESYVGAAFSDYDSFLVLSHFKGHSMAGFGGALKNLGIGMASREGKLHIHSAGETRERWKSAPTPEFLEAMADACKAALAAQPSMLFVNVMNNLSVDCDCDAHPAAPKMADIGILASADPVALDQACVDMIYASDDDSADLIERIESRDGQHVLAAAEGLGIGSRAYELVELG